MKYLPPDVKQLTINQAMPVGDEIRSITTELFTHTLQEYIVRGK